MATASAQVYSFEGIVPVIAPGSYVHPSAVLIGDVIIGRRCYVGANAVMRGDFGRIELHDDANLQDNCVVHSIPDFDCVMGRGSQIGHGAVIHGCRVGAEALIGMNSVVMDRATVGELAMVAAMSFVKVGGSIPPRVLATGIPARVVRPLTEADIAWMRKNGGSYVELAQRSLAGLQPAEPLSAAEPDRKRCAWPSLGF